MAEPIAEVGYLAGLCGWVSGAWQKLIADASNRLLVALTSFDPVPTNPMSSSPDAVSVADILWVDIGSHSVTAGKTFYLTDFYISDGTATTGVEYYYRVYADGVLRISGHTAPGHGTGEHLSTPLKATSGNEVAIHVYQWSGAARWYQAGFVGFEV